jgi:hypothetical protein
MLSDLFVYVRKITHFSADRQEEVRMQDETPHERLKMSCNKTWSLFLNLRRRETARWGNIG